MDSSKDFYMVSDPIHLDLISSIETEKCMIHWVKNWLRGQALRVLVKGASSGRRPVMSGALQGSILGPGLFSGPINDLDAGLQESLSEFVADTELGGAAGSVEGGEALQRDVAKGKSWAATSCGKFNKSKCRPCPWAGAAPAVWTVWGARGWRAAPRTGAGGCG